MINHPKLIRHWSARSARPRWRVFVCIAVAMTFTLATVTSVQASNFGRKYADDADHYWARVNLTTDGTTAANWGVTELNSSTEIDTFNDGTCKSHTDICFYDGNYETTPWIKSAAWWEGYNGLAYCNRNDNLGGLNGQCDRWYVLFDIADMNNMTTSELWELGCHEVGHTVGLKHTSDTNSCMMTDADGRTSNVLSQHDIDHVDTRYG